MEVQEGEREMEAGSQPLDALLEDRGLDNHALVAASGAHLTHKQVAKARRGRRLTGRMQRKVLAALNATGCEGAPFAVSDLFSYRGR